MNKSGIQDLKITPEAEPTTKLPSNVSGKQEVAFFNEGAEEYRLRHNQQNLGWLGSFFGSGQSASTNIAGLTIIVSLIFIGGAGLLGIENVIDKAVAMITLSLGYIFGVKTSEKSDK